MDSVQISQNILEIAQQLHSRNLLAAADGNISYRLSDDEILITPSGVAKAFMKEPKMAKINIQGQILEGNPSGERLMHLSIYRACPQARAVVHAHPPTAIAWSLANPFAQELPSQSLPEVILAAGRIPLVPYARPGSADMGEVLLPFLPNCRAMIMARHGAVCWGESLDEAYRGMERIEHVSQILLMAKQFGGAVPLEMDEIRALFDLRKQLGERLL